MMTLEDQRVVTLGELGNFLGDRKRAWGPGGGAEVWQGGGWAGRNGIRNNVLLSFFFILGHPEACGSPGQGSDPGRSFDLSHSCGNSESLTHCTQLGSNPCPKTPKRPLVPLQPSVSSGSNIPFWLE